MMYRRIGFMDAPIEPNAEYSEVDENGWRFRYVGNSKEYEPFCTFPRHVVTKEEPLPPPRKRCPFAAGIENRCYEGCAFYNDKRCELGKPTNGKRCPLNANLKCSEKCTMKSNGGCAIFSNGKE